MEWIEITEDSAMPEANQRVLVARGSFYKGNWTVEFAKYSLKTDQDGGKQHRFLVNGRAASVTHWMPLPDLPAMW